MLGLASALTTASSTSEQLYGLYLDGTGDYLDTGHTFQTTIRADFSWSSWVKPDDGQPGYNDVLIGTQNSSSEDIFYFGIDTAGKIFVQHKANNDHASYTTDNAIFPNGACNWTHVVVTADYTNGGAATAYKIFVNGIETSATLANAVSEANHELFTTTDNFYIGGQNNDGSIGSPFAGNIDEVAIFNAVLDADAVAAVYNSGKPFDLNNDRGNYDNSSALQGYWRMGNGPFDDIANGVVHDAHNPGYGSELWDGTQGDDANWTVHGSNTTAEDDDAVKVTYVDNGDGAYIEFRDAKDLNTDLTVGATYRCTADVKTNTGSIQLSVRHGSSNTNSTSVTSTDYVNREIFFVCEHATDDRLEFNSMGGSEIGWVRNISLKKLNGYPGITAADATFSADTPDDQAMSNVMTLDGTGDYLNMGTASSLKGFSAITVSFWAQIDVDQGNYDRFLDFSGTTDDRVFRMMCDTSDPDKLIWATWDQSDSAIATVTSSNALPLGSWVHCVGTWDGTTTSNAHKLYINNSTSDGGVATASNTNDLNNDAAAELTIGADKLSNGNYLAGRIDEVAIWNVALDADAVAAVYSAGRGYSLTSDTGNYDNASSLQGYWRMGNGVNDDLTNGFIFDQTAPTIGSNLVANPSFESVTTWTAYGGDPNAQTTEQVHSGTYAWKFERDGSETNKGVFNDAITVEVNTVYRVTWWSYCPAANTSKASYINQHAGNLWANLSTGTSYGGSVIAADTWVKQSELYRTASSGTTIKLRFGNGGSVGADGDIIYFDDIELVKIGGNPGITAADAAMIRQPI